MKIKLLKLLDFIIGKLFNLFLPKINLEKKYNKIKITKILIIRPGGLGDAILLLNPIVNLLSSNNFKKIDILCEKRNMQAFKLINGINNIFCYDIFKDFAKLTFFYKKYDLVIDTEQWHFLSSLFARYLGKYSTGFNTNKRRKNFVFSIAYSHKEYEQNMFNKLFREVSKHLNLNYNNYFLTLNCKNISLSYDIVIFTGASIIQKRWDFQKYIAIINKLKNKNFKIALIGGKTEAILNKKLANITRITDLTSNLTLSELLDLFKKSKILFSTDSGILHLGYISGIKTVSIFGPSDPQKWGPKGEEHIIIYKKLPCSPCSKFGYLPKCNFNIKCMKEITVNDVYEAILKLIKGSILS